METPRPVLKVRKDRTDRPIQRAEHAPKNPNHKTVSTGKRYQSESTGLGHSNWVLIKSTNHLQEAEVSARMKKTLMGKLDPKAQFRVLDTTTQTIIE